MSQEDIKAYYNQLSLDAMKFYPELIRELARLTEVTPEEADRRISYMQRMYHKNMLKVTVCEIVLTYHRMQISVPTPEKGQ